MILYHLISLTSKIKSQFFAVGALLITAYAIFNNYEVLLRLQVDKNNSKTYPPLSNFPLNVNNYLYFRIKPFELTRRCTKVLEC